jgi:hypothetical protein
LRIGRFVVLREHVGHRGGELVDVPVGVDVAGRLNRGVAEQLLDGLEVAGGVEHALAGCVATLVHLSPLVVPGATMPAVARQRYHQSCAAWPLIGLSG